MKVTAVMTGALLLFALGGVAQAANMFAGPVYGVFPDSCECELVNIATSTKTNLRVEMIDQNGVAFLSTLPFSLAAGRAAAFNAPAGGNSAPFYCKFTNASSTSFRASIGCYGGTGSDFVVVPGR
jgi:hypothetical protein